MYKIFLKFPDALRPSFHRLKEKLDDPDPCMFFFSLFQTLIRVCFIFSLLCSLFCSPFSFFLSFFVFLSSLLLILFVIFFLLFVFFCFFVLIFLLAVVSAGVNVICELARKNAKNYLALAPVLFRLLTKSANNWMLIKIVKLVR